MRSPATFLRLEPPESGGCRMEVRGGTTDRLCVFICGADIGCRILLRGIPAILTVETRVLRIPGEELV